LRISRNKRNVCDSQRYGNKEGADVYGEGSSEASEEGMTSRGEVQDNKLHILAEHSGQAQ